MHDIEFLVALLGLQARKIFGRVAGDELDLHVVGLLELGMTSSFIRVSKEPP